jgi:hypothetical protein
MGVEMPLTGSPIRLPSIERVDELRQRVAPIRPRRVILRQQQARCVRGELPERDLADVAALLQLDGVFGDGVVEPEITIADRLRQQCGLEHFPQRSEIEQRIGGDQPFIGAIGPPVIEEQAPPFDAQSHGDAGTVGGTIDATCRVTIRSASRSAATDGLAINAINGIATRNRMGLFDARVRAHRTLVAPNIFCARGVGQLD